jgi:hypothetical protein
MSSWRHQQSFVSKMIDILQLHLKVEVSDDVLGLRASYCSTSSWICYCVMMPVCPRSPSALLVWWRHLSAAVVPHCCAPHLAQIMETIANRILQSLDSGMLGAADIGLSGVVH